MHRCVVHAGMSTKKGLEKSTPNLYKIGLNEMAMGAEDDNFFIIYLFISCFTCYTQYILLIIIK